MLQTTFLRRFHGCFSKRLNFVTSKDGTSEVQPAPRVLHLLCIPSRVLVNNMVNIWLLYRYCMVIIWLLYRYYMVIIWLLYGYYIILSHTCCTSNYPLVN